VSTMGRVLILIPCSGSKKNGGIPEYNTKNSILNHLTDASKGHLLSLRRRLFEYFSTAFGPELGCSNDGTINYVEAYERYSGAHSQIYRQISSGSWEKLRKSQDLDLVIVSALYGFVRFDESIQNYNITMRDKIEYQALKTWWRNNGLCAILKDYISKNGISEVHNVLSNDYDDALFSCFIDVRVKYENHNFSEYKSGSNAHRGKWVDNFIQNF